ncbi:MAG: sporulation protein YqfD [Clostridia bacterium]|nr:sporulation protein YqfD [Clostridia bacterium]
MTDLARIKVNCTAESALRKLRKANLPVYNCEKAGISFLFSVKDKDIKKAFAIFEKPCYNVCVVSQSTKNSLIAKALSRIGLIVGAAAFIIISALSNLFVFKISVTGSGSYLSPEIKRIVYESGVKEFSYFKGFDAPLATGKILALPQVTFCNIQKSGSILHIDVQVDGEHSAAALKTPLVADRTGKIKSIVAVCGTAVRAVGETVRSGDELISPYTVVGEERVECLSAGYAELECNHTLEYVASEESDENLKSAYASVLLFTDKVISRTHSVAPCEGGVKYVIEFTYLHKLSINMK